MRLALSTVITLAVGLAAPAAPAAHAASARGAQQAPEDLVEPVVEGVVPAEEQATQWWLQEDPDVPAALPGLPAPTPTTGRDPNVPYGALIASTARRRGLPVALFTALVWQESAFKPRARSRVGARGLTQLMPATARMLGVRNSYDPAQNLDGGARYLRTQLTTFRGSKRLALAAYNAGPGAVKRFRGVPPYAETRTYVRRILSRETQLQRQGVR